MSFVKILIHIIFSTKNREPFLINEEIQKKVWNHIINNGKEKGIFIFCIGGHIDHCHLLFSLGADQKIQDVIQLIKGESSFWINKNKIINYKFEWQDEYMAVAVSESLIKKTIAYILNQKEHHRKTSFAEEYDLFMKMHNNDNKFIGLKPDSHD